MRSLTEALLFLLLLGLVLRVALVRRSHAVRLRGGIVALNLATGVLLGLLLGLTARDLWPAASVAGHDAALGGVAGFLLFGRLWRNLFQEGSARARNLLRRVQFLASLAAAVVLLFRWLR
jgi:H+/Cl- antiporter ClcA